MTSPLKFFIQRGSMWGEEFQVRMGRRTQDGWAVAEGMVFRVVPNDTHVETDPAFTMNRDDAQALIDELWHVGIRPTEGTGSAGSLAATQAHLKDMRVLVAKHNGVEFK